MTVNSLFFSDMAATLPMARPMTVMDHEKAHNPKRQYTGIINGFTRRSFANEKHTWPTHSKGRKDYLAEKRTRAPSIGLGESHLESLGFRDTSAMAFVVPKAPEGRMINSERLRVVTMGMAIPQKRVPPPLHPGTVLPEQMQSSQCLFGTSMNKSGNPFALRCQISLVP